MKQFYTFHSKYIEHEDNNILSRENSISKLISYSTRVRDETRPEI